MESLGRLLPAIKDVLKLPLSLFNVVSDVEEDFINGIADIPYFLCNIIIKMFYSRDIFCRLFRAFLLKQ